MTTERRGELVVDVANYPVKPEDINTETVRHFWDAFGRSETEISARWIVRLSQKLGGWVPFKLQQIEEFYNEGGYQGFRFNGLVEPETIRDYSPGDGIGGHLRKFGGGWMVEKDGMYYVTTEFVERIQESVLKIQSLVNPPTNPA